MFWLFTIEFCIGLLFVICVCVGSYVFFGPRSKTLPVEPEYESYATKQNRETLALMKPIEQEIATRNPPQDGSMISPYSLQATAERVRANMQAIEEAMEAFTLFTRTIPGTEPNPYRLDLHLIGCACGNTPADCQRRSCRKWRVELYAEGKITEQEAYPERAFVKQEQGALVMECEVRYE